MEAEEETGFVVCRSTVDHIFTLPQVIGKRDLPALCRSQKKYGSVPTVKLWPALKKINYQNKTGIKIDKILTKGFEVTQSLKQGF